MVDSVWISFGKQDGEMEGRAEMRVQPGGGLVVRKNEMARFIQYHWSEKFPKDRDGDFTMATYSEIHSGDVVSH
jgi:hypothetical protein